MGAIRNSLGNLSPEQLALIRLLASAGQPGAGLPGSGGQAAGAVDANPMASIIQGAAPYEVRKTLTAPFVDSFKRGMGA